MLFNDVTLPANVEEMRDRCFSGIGLGVIYTVANYAFNQSIQVPLQTTILLGVVWMVCDEYLVMQSWQTPVHVKVQESVNVHLKPSSSVAHVRISAHHPH